MADTARSATKIFFAIFILNSFYEKQFLDFLVGIYAIL